MDFLVKVKDVVKQALSKPNHILVALALLYLIRKFRYFNRSKHSQLYLKEKKLAPTKDIFANFIPNAQGLWLYTRSWEVENPKALVFISHGFGEHIQRYELVARTLNSAGYSVYGMDHQGHGMSDGDRTYVERFSHYVEDFIFFVKNRLASGPVYFSEGKQGFSQPAFLLGHSMGGLIAIHVANAEPTLFKGVVLSGPAIHPDPAVAQPIKIKLGQLLSNLLPKLPLDPLPVTGVSSDPQVVANYQEDILNYHGGMRVRTGMTMLKAMQDIPKFIKQVTYPFIILHGTADRLCLKSGSTFFHDQASSTDKTIILYDNLAHEIFNEPTRTKVLQDVLDWLNLRI